MLKKSLLLICGAVMMALFLFSDRSVVPSALRAPNLEGQIAYASGGHIWLWRNGPTQITSANERDGSPSLSPDGQQIAFIRYDDSFSDVRVASTEGGPAASWTNNRPANETGSPGYVAQALWVLSPSWSPDGSRLAYASDLGTDAPVLWLMGAGGDNPHSLNTDPFNPPVERPVWSPNGDEIAATSYGSGKQEIWVLDLNSGIWPEVAAPEGGAYDPAWSPDNQWLAYTVRDGNSHNIWVVPANGSVAPVQVTQSGRARGAAWSPSGERIAFLAEKDQHFEIFVVGISTSSGVVSAGSTEQVTENAGADAASGLSWSR